ncbi:F0F1 ATP synthase subunit B [Desmospora activa]|uniref:ATP synthase subunit b n=1 Tax=Desmospora activa DSM 45169 TaxID=1121389 RepID=A0A2T4Z4D4_9BACL|nr:F0F1 ATP synthase subunit B [Desmospora activa]PTM56754.1 ATP synthase F0 subcomplex B subunit [Desmospora activa DSM 45169]
MSIELGTMLFQLGAFLVLMLLVSRFALRPIMSTMEERQNHIENQISQAEKNREEAEKLAAEQREALKQARQEAQEILERAKSQKEREAEKILQEANTRAQKIIEDATAEINREKEKALHDLQAQVGGLSVALASKMIEKELSEKEHSQLVDRYLKQVGELQ